MLSFAAKAAPFALDAAFFTKLVMIALYFGGLFWIGVWASRKIEGMADYYVAGKQLNYWLVSFSSRATGESGWLLLGLTGMGFAVGIHAFWVVLGEVVGVALCWVFLTQRFKVLTDRYDSITVTDYLSDRVRDSGHLIRIIATLALAIFVTAYVSAQFSACGKAFTGFLGIPHVAGVLIGVVIVGFYSVAGGFYAVAWSDLVQGLLMLLGLILVPLVAIVVGGGWTSVMTQVHAADPGLLSVWGSAGFGWKGALSAAGLVAVGLGYLGSPQLFVRFIAVKDRRELGKGAVVAVLFTILADAGAVLAGMAGRALLQGGQLGAHKALLLKDSEQILPVLANVLFPLLITGILVAVVLAAIMSTADSLLVLVSSAVVRDTWQKIFRPDADPKALTRLSRMVTLALCVVALLFALDPKSKIFWFVLFAWTGITTAFCPVLILSLFWKGLSKWGTAAGMLTGLTMTVLWKLYPLRWVESWHLWAQEQGIVALTPFWETPSATLHSVVDHMLIAFSAATLMAVVVSLLTTPPEEAEADLEHARSEAVDLWTPMPK